MKVLKNIEMLHPHLQIVLQRVQKEIIEVHNIPMRIFETGREHDRHESLIKKGKTRDILSRHLFNLENDPPLFSTAVDYVYYNGRWSWNLRDSTISSWYLLFGNLILDKFPELEWYGYNRKSTNYCHFQLREMFIRDNISKYPCVVP